MIRRKDFQFLSGQNLTGLALAIGLAASLNPLCAGQRPDLSGQWKLNPAESDSSTQRVHEAIQNSQTINRPMGTGYPGAGVPMGRTPMGGVPMGGGPRGRIPGSDIPPTATNPQNNDLDEPNLDALARQPQHLSIGEQADKITLTDQDDHAQTLYPDGKKHKQQTPDGQSHTMKTRWQGNSLVSETSLGREGKLWETYRLRQDGQQLEVEFRLNNSRLSMPLTVRSVYDRADKASNK